jgi:hypothetical protein
MKELLLRNREHMFIWSISGGRLQYVCSEHRNILWRPNNHLRALFKYPAIIDEIGFETSTRATKIYLQVYKT